MSPELNLKPIKMGKLGAVVAIAGRNGAGKSRLLKKIEGCMGDGFVIEADATHHLQELQTLIAQNPKDPSINFWKANRDKIEPQLRSRRCVTLSEDRKPHIVRFVPSILSLIDPSQMTRARSQIAANNINNLGIAHLPEGTFARIQVCQDRRWEATHPEKTIRSEEAEKAVTEYDRLKGLIGQFLNTELTRSVNGEAELFGLTLGLSALSDGQKVILQLCVAIHAQATNLNDVIIFMDEPENHLHPAALLDLIDAIKGKLVDGQLWIATHSVPLLANIDSAAIWWMENGEISKAGAKPEVVLTGLLGDETRRDQLANFLDLPFVLASNKFASECLLPPSTIAPVLGDPQMLQISEMLGQLRDRFPIMRLLDFGSGKGRLPAEIAESWSPEQRAKIDYIAFDSSRRDAEECRTAIARLHSDPERRLFHDATALRAEYDEGSFHVVVMCNVLHEILPADWSDLFGAQGKITRLLHRDGFLLIVEVQQLPYGERAHHQGFLVLDTAQLRKLFLITEADGTRFAHVFARGGWLKAHLISKILVERFSPDSRRLALEDLRDTARDRIRELRESGTDYKHGRLYGFWVQQFANASLAIS